ncbi:hypothetical protein [Phreatobacter sp.]|uniref:hypothetical protein n=1 Tax=Phreatobacter sp. TaxID=1966341 RepID=UPI003F70AF8E
MNRVAFLADPGRLPWAKAAAIGAGLLAVPLVWWSLLRLAGVSAPAPAPAAAPLALIVVSAVVIAPLIETAVLALVHWLAVVRLKVAVPLFVAAAVVLAVLAHLPVTLVRTPVTAVLFLVFSLQYAGWFAASGWRVALPGVALAHAVYNAGSLALAPLWMLLLRPV